MKLPAELVALLEAQLNTTITRAEAVGGGCISNTTRLDLAAGARAFLKWARAAEQPSALFAAEATSLRALAATRTVRVPAVLAVGAGETFSWLLLEWLEPGARTAGNQAALGEQLAQLHRQTATSYGWTADNFIGSLLQSNRKHNSWPAFWRAERMLPQLRLAHNQFSAAQQQRFQRLLDSCDDLLSAADQDGPSLLHGDLWSGNMHMLADGSPALIDPASYYGHCEVDLAMTRLFGGFSGEFYRAYDEAWPGQPGREQRLLIYQLYYLLVHVNLFGGSYVPQTLSLLNQLG